MIIRALLLVFATLLSFSIFSQEGIQFENTSMEMALEKAKIQNKLIFVDAYTTWCGPCKWMNNKVFSDPQVAAYYNANFINLKIDMEKGEGPKFGQKYQVKAYPTLLFIDSDGIKVHLGLGARGVDEFLVLGQRANDPTTQLLQLEKKYSEGDRSPAFLKSYVTTLDDGGLDKGQAVNDYLETQDNWKSNENLEFIYKHSGYEVSNYLFKYMMEQRPAFEKALGESKVIKKMDQAVAMSLPPDADAAQLRAAYQKYFPESWEPKYMVALLRNITSGSILASNEETARITNQYIADYPQKSWSLLNGVAWHIFEATEDTKLLTEASKWAVKSVELESNAYNNDTAAWIFFKLNDTYNATAYAATAIKKGVEEGIDVSSTRELILKIKAAN